jgi:hypothetical protein
MSDITKSSDAGLVRGEYLHPQSRKAGVEIAAGDALYIDTAGLFQKVVRPTVFITGAYGLEVKFDGLAVRSIPSGTVGEIYGAGAEIFYADSGLTIGAPVFPSATAGKLADAAVASADLPVAKVITATNILLIKGV